MCIRDRNYILPRILKQTRLKYPEIDYRMLEGDSSQVIQSVLRFEADLGIGSIRTNHEKCMCMPLLNCLLYTSKNSMHLMRAEVPGPEKDKLVPKTKTTARILYGIYFGLTLILVILLMFGGMNLFDSLIHAFGSAGTGGCLLYTSHPSRISKNSG